MTPIQYKVYFTPKLTATTYGAEVEVSAKIIDTGVSTMKRSIDAGDYDIGIFYYGDVTLKAINKKDVTFLQLINQYINTINQTSIPGFLKRYLINFGRNKTYEYINSVVIGEFIYIKLANPIPEDIETYVEPFGGMFWVYFCMEDKYPNLKKVVYNDFNQLNTNL